MRRDAIIYDLKADGLKCPVGVDNPAPRFSWKMQSDERGWKQSAYQLIVKDGDKVVWDSGKVESADSTAIAYEGQGLRSSAEYDWTVHVWDAHGTQRSAASTFETGLFADDLAGVSWISAGDTQSEGAGAPVFRKSFPLFDEAVSAKLYTSGLGVYEAYLNGKRIGRKLEDGTMQYDELKPGSSEMGARKLYYTYDVTDMLAQRGQNVLSAVVTSGWWTGRIAANYGGKPAFLAKLILQYADGTTRTIVTDSSWKSAMASPVTFADIYDGETHDARISTDWMLPSFDDSGWADAVGNTEFTGELVSGYASTVVVRSDLERAVQSVAIYDGVTGNSTDAYGTVNVVRTADTGEFTLAAGETAVIDFGQNFAGWEKFRVSGESGTKITVRHAEMLNDRNGAHSRGNDGPEGSIYQANLRSARAQTNYILRGGGIEEYHPSFTYYGFRYAEITCDAPVTFHEISGEVVTSVTEDTGFLTTSNADINQLISNIRWGQYSNYLSVPTDCPQRDERLGWTADTQVFAQTGMYLGANENFLHKYMQNLRDSQRADGALPGTSPTGQYQGADWGGFGWADAGVIIPYQLYMMYGDVSVIHENWELMTRYMDYLSTTDKLGGRPVWGDHLSPEDGDAAWMDALAREMLGVAFYAWDALMMEKMASAIGLPDVAEHYRGVYEQEKEFFISRYVNADGTLVRGYQTQCLYALYLDLLPDEASVAAVTEQLTSNIERHNRRMQTGFLGTAIILPALTKIGRSDLAYMLLFQDENPSWLYSVMQGATTTWERWDSYTIEDGFGDAGMNSFNHYAYGAVAGWMFSSMAGIGYDPSAPGFANILFAPRPNEKMKSVEASYESAYGTVTAKSCFEGDRWNYTVTVPANATATVKLPVPSLEGITVNGKKAASLSAADGVAAALLRDGYAVFEVTAGTFSFSVDASARKKSPGARRSSGRNPQ